MNVTAWERPKGVQLWDGGSPPDGRSADPAQGYVVLETLRTPGRRGTDLEPFSPEWFSHLEQKRYGRHGAWLPRLLEFAKHPGEHVLGIGDGLGTDWCRYAAHGAHVSVCHPDAVHLGHVRANFEHRDLQANFLQSPWDSLPIPDGTIDVAVIGGPLMSLKRPEDLASLAEEIYRVLKPGGKILLIMPAFYDVTWWVGLLVPWHRWMHPIPRALRPKVRFTGRELRRLFGHFPEPRVRRRHLRRSELPHLWRGFPLPILERLFGRFLFFKAFKPISSALPPVAEAA